MLAAVGLPVRTLDSNVALRGWKALSVAESPGGLYGVYTDTHFTSTSTMFMDEHSLLWNGLGRL
ncbi:hypothetical protein P4S72_25215 [Vibrio sp. PP-XX7]